MIVEDEFLIATDLQGTLESHGWRVIGPAPNVRAALRLLEDELPCVAILDVNLDGEPVTPVATALREKKVPFVVASAYDRPEQVGGEVLAGAPNAGKPVSIRRLLAALAQLTGS
jgi:DNA-binding response OmpR family regulator